jgi:hypothetical protein
MTFAVRTSLIRSIGWRVADNSQPFPLFLPNEFLKRSTFSTSESVIHRTRSRIHRRLGHNIIHVIYPRHAMGIDTGTHPQSGFATRLPNGPTPLINIVKLRRGDHDRTVTSQRIQHSINP